MSLRFAVGLDLSFTSPGWTIYDIKLNKWCIYAFAQKKREKDTFYQTENVTIQLLPEIPSDFTDVAKYVYMEHHIITTLDKHISKDECNQTMIFIEEYVFDANKCNNNYKLHEFGGIIKYALYKNNFFKVDTIVSGAWKKKVIGFGSSSKLNTIKFVSENGPCVNMLTVCGYREEDLRWDAQEKKYHVETPCEDLADSVCIAMAIFVTPHAKIKPLTDLQLHELKTDLPTTNKNKKRKKIIPLKKNTTPFFIF